MATRPRAGAPESLDPSTDRDVPLAQRVRECLDPEGRGARSSDGALLRPQEQRTPDAAQDLFEREIEGLIEGCIQIAKRAGELLATSRAPASGSFPQRVDGGGFVRLERWQRDRADRPAADI